MPNPREERFQDAETVKQWQRANAAEAEVQRLREVLREYHHIVESDLTRDGWDHPIPMTTSCLLLWGNAEHS